MAKAPQGFLGYTALLGAPVPSKWDRVKQALWETNLNAPVRGIYNLMNADPYTLYTDTGAAGQQAAVDSFDAASGVTVGSMPMPKPANSLSMGMSAGLKTRGGQNIVPHDTGWVFKDVKRPHAVMEKGDWRRANMLDPQDVELPIGSLNATQGKVNADFSTPISQNGELPFVIRKNGEYYVQDGHHRLTKIAMSGKQTARVRLVDLDGTMQADFPLLDGLE